MGLKRRRGVTEEVGRRRTVTLAAAENVGAASERDNDAKRFETPPKITYAISRNRVCNFRENPLVGNFPLAKGKKK